MDLRHLLPGPARRCALGALVLAAAPLGAQTLTLTPAVSALVGGQALPLQAKVNGAPDPRITWTVVPAQGHHWQTDGPQCRFFAPKVIQGLDTVRVRASLTADPSVYAESVLTLFPAEPWRTLAGAPAPKATKAEVSPAKAKLRKAVRRAATGQFTGWKAEPEAPAAGLEGRARANSMVPWKVAGRGQAPAKPGLQGIPEAREAEANPAAFLLDWLKAEGCLHSERLPHRCGDPATADAKAQVPAPEPRPFGAVVVDGQAQPALQAGRRHVVGYGLPVRLDWKAEPGCQGQQLFLGGPGDWFKQDLTGQDSVEVRPVKAVTTAWVNGLTAKDAKAGTWLATDHAATFHVRGLVPLAGNPVTEPGLLDGLGEAARFMQPHGLALIQDASMNHLCLVTDAGSHAIRAVEALDGPQAVKGRVTTPWGHAGEAGFVDGAGPAARFRQPTFLAADPAAAEVCLVADTGNHAIRRLAGSQVTTLAGTGLAGHFDSPDPAAARFNGPRGLVRDAKGNTFVADAGNFVLRRVAADGAVTTLAGLPGVAGHKDGSREEATFTALQGLALADEHLYVVDGHAVRRVHLGTGAVETFCGSVTEPGFLALGRGGGALAWKGVPCLRDPQGLQALGQELWVADRGNHSIRVLDLATGGQKTVVGDPALDTTRWGLLRDGVPGPLPAAQAALASPSALVLGSNGSGYLATGACVAEASMLFGRHLVLGEVPALKAAAPLIEAGKPCQFTFSLATWGAKDPVVMDYQVAFVNAAGAVDTLATGRCARNEPQTVMGAFSCKGPGKVVVRGLTQQGVGVTCPGGPLEVEVK